MQAYQLFYKFSAQGNHLYSCTFYKGVSILKVQKPVPEQLVLLRSTKD